MTLCVLCETRKPRRWCPGKKGEICAQCCGEKREETVDCPLDCEYLIESRLHEKLRDRDPATMPERDLRITENFLDQHTQVLFFLSKALYDAAVETPGTVDSDVREALEALVKTYRTLDSGLIYETRPANPYAAGVQERMRKSIEMIKEKIAEASGVHSLRDNEILMVLAFLLRLEWRENNGRRKGTAFLSSLRRQLLAARAESGSEA